MEKKQLVIKINRWVLFKSNRINEIPYILDLSNEDLDDNEIAMCIDKQFYGDFGDLK